MKPLSSPSALIDQVYERLIQAIAEGELEPGERVRQEDLAARLGVSRQPVSHALQLIKRQGLLSESGRRGLAVAPIERGRILDLYQVRGAMDALAARLAAERVATGAAPAADVQGLESAIRMGETLRDAPTSAYVQADVAFHVAIYRLSGNPAIEETLASQWLHLKRSMGMVLRAPDRRVPVWEQHSAIADAIFAGNATGAETAARDHAGRAAMETARRLAEPEAAA